MSEQGKSESLGEKKVWNLQIDPEFKDMIPPLRDEEMTCLQEQIEALGCTEPLLTWGGTIVDGHNRYRICTERGIPFWIKEMGFKDRNEAKICILKKQMGRRNLSDFQKCLLALKFKDIFAAEAKASQGARNDLYIGADLPRSSGKTRKRLSEAAGVSDGTMAKVIRIVGSGDEELTNKLLSGELSIDAADRILRKRKTGAASPDSKAQGAGNKVRKPKIEEPAHMNEPKQDAPQTDVCVFHRGRETEDEVQTDRPVDEAAGDDEPTETHQVQRGRKSKYAIPGTEMRENGLAHVATGMEDRPESFKFVVDQLRVSVETYVRYADVGIKWMTVSMATEENEETLNHMIDTAAERVKSMVHQRMSELRKESLSERKETLT